MSEDEEITCSSCGIEFTVTYEDEEAEIKFCPFCAEPIIFGDMDFDYDVPDYDE